MNEITQNATKYIKARKLVVLVAFVSIVLGYTGSHIYATRNVSSAVACKDVCVSIFKDGFSKSEVAVKVGTFIEFAAEDGQTHNLALGSGLQAHSGTSKHSETSDVASEPHRDGHEHVDGTESGEFGKGEAWRVQFRQKGTYIVHDHLRPEMSVLVVAY